MRGILWLIPLGLLSLCLYALAEEVTLVTTYPSPRGVYKDLKAVANVTVGTFADQGAKLVVAGTPQDPVSMAECPPGTDWYDEDRDTVREDQECLPTGLLVTPSGTVAIGTTTPTASALLELASSTQGVLHPRMTTTQRDAIATPATGLLLFNTDTDHNTFEFWDGTAWKSAVGGLQSGDVASVQTVTVKTPGKLYPDVSCSGTLYLNYPAAQNMGYAEYDPHDVASFVPPSGGPLYSVDGELCTAMPDSRSNPPTASCVLPYVLAELERQGCQDDAWKCQHVITYCKKP